MTLHFGIPAVNQLAVESRYLVGVGTVEPVLNIVEGPSLARKSYLLLWIWMINDIARASIQTRTLVDRSA